MATNVWDRLVAHQAALEVFGVRDLASHPAMTIVGDVLVSPTGGLTSSLFGELYAGDITIRPSSRLVGGGSTQWGGDDPQVELWALEMSGRPAFDVRGQDGGQGGRGQPRGAGGRGGKGQPSHSTWVRRVYGSLHAGALADEKGPDSRPVRVGVREDDPGITGRSRRSEHGSSRTAPCGSGLPALRFRKCGHGSAGVALWLKDGFRSVGIQFQSRGRPLGRGPACCGMHSCRTPGPHGRCGVQTRVGWAPEPSRCGSVHARNLDGTGSPGGPA